jgi:hypothetical protein
LRRSFDRGGPHYRELRELFHVLHMAYEESKKLFDELVDEDENNDWGGNGRQAAKQWEIIAELDMVSGLAMKRGPSVDFGGYIGSGRSALRALAHYLKMGYVIISSTS